MKRLVYWKKFISSQKYKNDIKKGFNLYQAEDHALYEEKSAQENHLLFVIEGKMTIRCNQYSTREVLYNQCILIPKSASVEIMSIEKCKFIDFIFDELNNICEWDIFEKCNPYYKEVAYDFRPVAVCPPVSRFLDQLEYYFRHGLDCEPFQELKERELFFLLSSYYSREELAYLLYPLMGEPNFKNLILTHYKHINSVAELAVIAGMSRTIFDNKFKEVFGTSARKWILQETANQVRFRAKQPNITITDLMDEFKFNSATHFNRFCKQYFDCTPGELIRRSRNR